MSFLVGGYLAATGAGLSTIATGATIGSMVGSTLSNIFGAQTKDEERAQKANAKAVYEQKIKLLEEKKELSLDKTTMGFEIGVGDVSQKTSSLYTKSDFATMNPIQKQKQDEMRKLFDTRQMQLSEADLGYRTGKLSAEEAYESTVSDIESQTPWYV